MRFSGVGRARVMNDGLLEKTICGNKVLCMDCDRMWVEDGGIPGTNDHIMPADGIGLYLFFINIYVLF